MMGRKSISHFYFETYKPVPLKTCGPVGCGIPPTGSTVTAKDLQSIPWGILAMHIFPLLNEAGMKAPALMGLPTIGTIHI